MAKYNITYSCGHEGTVQLFGKSEERERKTWLSDRRICSGYTLGKRRNPDLPVLRRGYPSAQGRDQGTGIPVDSRGCQPDGLYAQAGYGMG